MKARMRGFTLIEVMVALVIVAFGMGAVLAALSASANNIAALHDKTLAQWIALNLVADTRLNLQMPTAGSTQGDVKAFGNADWHWQQDIVAVPSIPGLLEITVRVQRTGTSTAASNASRLASSSSSGGASSVTSGSITSGSTVGSSGGLGTSSGFGSSGGFGSFGSSSGFGSSGGFGLSSGSSGAFGRIGSGISAFASGDKDQHWLATVIGFRGDAVAASSGEAPDWSGTDLSGTSSSSSGGASSSSGSILNPGTSSASPLTGSSSGTIMGSSSSGGS
jgi:general secretion pathway protein I